MSPSISILFPNTWTDARIRKAVAGLDAWLNGRAGLSYSIGDTDAPCVDTVPMGGESMISRYLDGVR
jgi:hypothetical protein